MLPRYSKQLDLCDTRWSSTLVFISGQGCLCFTAAFFLNVAWTKNVEELTNENTAASEKNNDKPEQVC